MIKRNCSNCKYVKIFTHHVGCIGTPSRRTVFIWGKNAKRWDVPNMASRDIHVRNNGKTRWFIEVIIYSENQLITKLIFQFQFQFSVIFHQSKTRLQNSPVRYRTSHKPTYIQKTLNKQKNYTNKCFKIKASVIQNTGQCTNLHE
jgi:hypothetical protein